MDSYDMLRLQNIAYINNLVAGAMVELEAMKVANIERREKGLALAYGEEAYMKLLETWQIGHNAVLANLHNGL